MAALSHLNGRQLWLQYIGQRQAVKWTIAVAADDVDDGAFEGDIMDQPSRDLDVEQAQSVARNITQEIWNTEILGDHQLPMHHTWQAIEAIGWSPFDYRQFTAPALRKFAHELGNHVSRCFRKFDHEHGADQWSMDRVCALQPNGTVHVNLQALNSDIRVRMLMAQFQRLPLVQTALAKLPGSSVTLQECGLLCIPTAATESTSYSQDGLSITHHSIHFSVYYLCPLLIFVVSRRSHLHCAHLHDSARCRRVPVRLYRHSFGPSASASISQSGCKINRTQSPCHFKIR